MPDELLHVDITAQCPHAGSISVISSNNNVKVSGKPVATQNDNYPISGCPFTVGTKPQPCVNVKWIVPASRVKVNNNPVIFKTSTGICQSAEQAPQGPPNIIVTQIRVKGT